MECNNMQSQVLDASATIKGGSDSMRLSSDSIDNEKENVSKFMNYENVYFSYIRLGQEGTCRYYENIDSAYHYPKSVIRISLCRTAKRNPLIFPI